MGLGAFFGKTQLGQYIVKDTLKSLSHVNSFTLPSSTYITTGTPVWRDLSQLSYLLKCYYENPIVQSIINLKAEAFANIRFSVKDLKSGEVFPLNEYEKDKGKLNELLSQPNPLQNTYEWLRHLKVNREVFGNSYTYASIPEAFNFKSYQDITVINNLPSYLVTPVLTGAWLEAETRDEIIKEYVLENFNGIKKHLPTNKILHLNNVNLKLDKNFTEGVSNLIALKNPISNIDAAFESKNVIITKRGPTGILSSNMKDDSTGSTLPLREDELKEVHKEFEKYGLMNGQFSHILSPYALTYQKTGFGVKELMLFEEISHSAIAVCHAYGVPEEIVKYYIKNGTLGTDSNVAEKRLYDSTIIPESEDFIKGLNNFFKTKEHGIVLIGSYDHVKVLQKNKKEEAEVKKITSETAKSNFMSGLTNYGQYAIACDVELEDKKMEKKMIWDLDENQLNAIGINNKKVESNGQ